MRRILACLFAIGASVRADPPVSLGALDWCIVADTLRMAFAFKGERPPQYRIHAASENGDRKALMIDFAGAKLDGTATDKWPYWAKASSTSDAGLLSIRIDLNQSVPWKANWRGNVLQVDLIDKVHRRHIWQNSWVLGGTGAALAAGGFTVWMLAGRGSASASGQDEGLIPRPGFTLPK